MLGSAKTKRARIGEKKEAIRSISFSSGTPGLHKTTILKVVFSPTKLKAHLVTSVTLQCPFVPSGKKKILFAK